MIADIARALDVPVVTADNGFKRIDGLAVENVLTDVQIIPADVISAPITVDVPAVGVIE